MELFLEFAHSKEVITNENMNVLKTQSWDYLIKAAQKQSVKTEENRMDNMFFRAVQELLASKKIYLKRCKFIVTNLKYSNEIIKELNIKPNNIYHQTKDIYKKLEKTES